MSVGRPGRSEIDGVETAGIEDEGTAAHLSVLLVENDDGLRAVGGAHDRRELAGELAAVEAPRVAVAEDPHRHALAVAIEEREGGAAGHALLQLDLDVTAERDRHLEAGRWRAAIEDLLHRHDALVVE